MTTRRLCTIAGFYRYAVGGELLDHSPAAHVRRPRQARVAWDAAAPTLLAISQRPQVASR
jgi:site-specific recombinase XerD